MDRSITTGCFALSNAIGKTSSSLNAFVRDVRESRAELETLSGELHSLDGVLDLLRDDASSFPPTLAARTPTVLQHCTAVINELEGYVMVLNSNELSTQAKRLRWAATKSHMAKLRLTLDGYKSTIGLALDLVAFTSAAGRDSGRSSPTEAASASKNISKTVEEMGRLSARLQGDFQKNAALRSYLDALQLYAESTGVSLEPDHAASSMKSVSDAPDSAIDMNDDAAFKSEPPTPDLALRTEDLDELLDELREMPSNNTNRDRPPTPPPRNMRRSLSVSSVAPPPIAISRPSLTLRPTDYTFVTTITAGGNDSASPPPPIKRGFLGRMFSTSGKKRTMSSSSAASIKTVDSRPSTAASTAPSIAIVPSSGSGSTERPVGGLVRRGSRRMSTSIKSLPQMFKVAEDPAAEADTEPNAVFGVSLQKSLQVAHGSAKTRHTTGGNGKKTASGSTSHRDFPLCVHKCVQFITSGTDEGVAVPDIFGEPGDARRLAALRRLFSEGPSYGDDVDWEWFTVYEAADLILCYLSELPKPLVPESVAKRWISLSRQATVSNGSRTDQCLDFWEEALLGVRPGPPRNLLKLLLNLWADVAEAADHNGMTAERLAGRVVQPLMHTSARTYTTDYMLGLAFLIRKRSEYLALMQGNKGKAKAAF